MTSRPERPPSLSTSSSLPSNAQNISQVVTVPPWAKDEPPSPQEPASSSDTYVAKTESRPSDVASYHSNNTTPSRWWTFTLPRPRDPQLIPEDERRKERTVSWLSASNVLKEASGSLSRKDRTVETQQRSGGGGLSRDWNLSITLPSPSQPFTLAHTATPGWDTPWTGRVAAQGPSRYRGRVDNSLQIPEENDLSDPDIHLPKWKKRQKKFRSFILTNAYVPLLFRFINIAFTTAALGVAIRIRQWEQSNHVTGALGSSPTLVIIFAPLTLVHVMVAIYLEYFGRPLGLWRTSAKLAHTLLEVLFICAWSAALSLCFDNFFTSLIPCAPPSSTSWYNELPRPPSNLPTFEGSPGDLLCDSQVALICLVGVGLLMYCTNLVISLFRIFEKVKYQPLYVPSHN